MEPLFRNYTPIQLRLGIELELQKNSDILTASHIAVENLKRDPHFYDMKKARSHKYISRKPDGKGGWAYTYADSNSKNSSPNESVKSEKTPQTETPEFKKWFGDSKVVDKEGKPLVVYHGTNTDFQKFDIEKSGGNYHEGEGAFFFTDKENRAENYAKLHAKDKGGKANVKSVFLKITNPYIEHAEDYLGAVEKYDRNSASYSKYANDGHDGIIILSPSGSLFVAFSPHQIKSATGNSGKFDSESDDMTKASQLSIGTKIEFEHKETVNFIRSYLEKNGEMPPDKEIYKHIAMNHTEHEMKDYYTRLVEMEDQADKDKKRPQLEIDIIKFLLDNPNPTDAKVHAFADERKIDHSKLESVVYRIATERAKMSSDMFKAKTHKYLTKKSDGKGGWEYTYAKDPAQAKSDKAPAEKKEFSVLDVIRNLFGLSDNKAASDKMKSDYWSNKISEKFNIALPAWSYHVTEYLKDKIKWDAKLAGGEKNPAQERKSAPSGEKRESVGEKKPGFSVRLPVMKEVQRLYSSNVPALTIESAIAEARILGAEAFARGESSATALNPRMNEILKELDLPVGGALPIMEAFAQAWHKANMSAPVPENKVEAPKEETKKETPEQKKEDANVSEAIKEATPETRNKKEREILGIPEPTEDTIIETPKIVFTPEDVFDLEIPGWRSSSPSGKYYAKDFTGVKAKDVYLIQEKTVLTKERPSYIPEVDEKFFEYNRNFLPIVKVGKDRYIIQTKNRDKVYDSNTQDWVQNEGFFAVVNRDVAAATFDYYIKRKKAQTKQSHEEFLTRMKEKYAGRDVKFRGAKRESLLPDNKMSTQSSSLLSAFIAPGQSAYSRSSEIWTAYREIRSDLKQKTEDMEIQLEEHYNSHTKGRETAYGDSGVKDDLLGSYGVKVKRQNGAEISPKEIGEVKQALDDVYSVFGNRSDLAQKFGLKISHSGDKMMHARKAAGLFTPANKAIGITAAYEQTGTSFILAHEWAHFMDYYLGEKSRRHYISDDPEHIANQIASTFRKNMAKPQNSAYQTRTCECFARAMEQYWAIKTNNQAATSGWDTGNHPTEEVFVSRVQPLIDQFLKENDSLLKAMFGTIHFKKITLTKRLDPVTGTYTYRRKK